MCREAAPPHSEIFHPGFSPSLILSHYRPCWPPLKDGTFPLYYRTELLNVHSRVEDRALLNDVSTSLCMYDRHRLFLFSKKVPDARNPFKPPIDVEYVHLQDS